jgi:hypothetical protein
VSRRAFEWHAFFRAVVLRAGCPPPLGVSPAMLELTRRFVAAEAAKEDIVRRVMPPVPVDGPEIEGEGPCLINPS